MNVSDESSVDHRFVKNAVEATIRIGLALIVAAWCFQIVAPFVGSIAWGVIIAVACLPMYRWLEARLGGRGNLAAGVFVLAAFAVLIIPTVMLGNSLAETAQGLNEGFKGGTIAIPPPPESVKTWPLVGEQLAAFWQGASQNLQGTLENLAPQLKEVALAFLGLAAGAGLAVLQFFIAIVIAGALLANADSCRHVSKAIAHRLSAERGEIMAEVSAATVRSVAQGVLGVAIIQSLLAGVGMLAVGVPGAGFWTLLVLLLAIMQLPPALVLLPVALYVFSQASTTVAVVFLIYALLVSGSDALLKPLFLGRGMDTPMLVILLGAIGGMMTSGIIGLFVGAVILALGYELFMAWLREDGREAQA